MLTDSALTDDPAELQTIDDVLARMEAIQALLPEDDGVARFNRVYHQVTSDLGQRLRAQPSQFKQATWLESLDVTFAKLYFGAVRTAVTTPDDTPHCWYPLLVEQRHNPQISTLQFVLGGMAAHIGHDLPLALLSGASRRSPLLRARRDDYQRVNGILAQADSELRLTLLPRAMAEIAPVHQAESVVENWDISRARDAAWLAAELLWRIRGVHMLYSAAVAELDRTIGMLSRLLLFAPP